MAEWDFGPKHNLTTAWNFCVIQTMSMIEFGMYNFCLASFLMSDRLTLSANANNQSFSMSAAFAD
jgi:hypothetical protein